MNKPSLIAMAVATLMLAACDKEAPPPPPAPADTPAANASDIAPDPALPGSGVQSHTEAPKRKAGLWEFTTFDAKGAQSDLTKLCVGPKSEAVYSAFDQIADHECDEKSFAKGADGWTYTTLCGPQGSKPVATRGKLTGDIATSYKMDETMDSSPGAQQSRTAKMVGPCPADMQDGDMLLPESGLKYSVLVR